MEPEASQMEFFLWLAEEQGRYRNFSAMARFRVLQNVPQAQGPSDPVWLGEDSAIYVLVKKFGECIKTDGPGG